MSNVANGSDQRPNILLITTDQHRWDCVGYEGVRGVETPNIDRLAASGTTFGAAITPNVVCQPSRASILTGMLPLTHGVYDNQVSFDAALVPTGWASELSQAGYRTGFIGKAHFGNDESHTPWGAPESRVDSATFPENWAGPYLGFSHAELMILGHWHKYLPCEEPPRGQHFERWFWSHGAPGEAWRRWSENVGPDRPTAAQTWFSALPAEWHSTTWVTERGIDFLDHQASHDEPFAAWISYPDPHHSFDCPEPWSRRYNAADVDISRTHERDLDRRPWWHRAALENEPLGRTEENRVLRREYSRIEPQTDGQLAEMTANYFGMISFLDDGIGRILQALERNGLAENTIVIFTTDHGELLGDHGLYLKGPTHYESLLRVPLVIAGAGIDEGQRVETPVSTLDLAPTIAEWAGRPARSHDQGQSLTDVLGAAGADGVERAAVWNEWNMQPARAGVELHLRTVRTRDAKLTIDLLSGEGELYDLANDPDEMDNRWNDPGVEAQQADLVELVHARPGPILEDLRPSEGGEIWAPGTSFD